MLVLALLLFALQLVRGASQFEEFKDVIDKCKAESQFKGNLLFIGDNAPREAKCFFACMMKEKGAVNDDGTFNGDKIKETIQSFKFLKDDQKEQKIQAAMECIDEVKAANDNCETAYSFRTCLQQKNQLRF